jgi:hypothetical protein
MTHSGFMAGEGAFTHFVSNPWQSFHGHNVDMAKMHDQAQKRMADKREPTSTIVHDHPHGVLCEGRNHTVYDHVAQKATFLDENGNEIPRDTDD